jgi:hypothetical protein
VVWPVITSYWVECIKDKMVSLIIVMLDKDQYHTDLDVVADPSV